MYLDVGILGARCELFPATLLQGKQGGYKGYMAENFVAQELVSTDIHTMRQLYSWQAYKAELGKAELEFLENTGSGIIPIEVKASANTKAKSLEKYREKYHPEKSVLLSANNISYDTEKNIYYCPIYLAALRPWLRLYSDQSGTDAS
jgi:hypothetical protein